MTGKNWYQHVGMKELDLRKEFHKGQVRIGRSVSYMLLFLLDRLGIGIILFCLLAKNLEESFENSKLSVQKLNTWNLTGMEEFVKN